MQNPIQHEKFEHQHFANIMENERFELQTKVAIPLKWQLLAPKMLRVARTEQQIQKKQNRKKKQNNSGPQHRLC